MLGEVAGFRVWSDLVQRLLRNASRVRPTVGLPDSDQTKALRALTRTREDLVHARVALSGQLRAELERFWPGPIGLFAKLDSPISPAFLERYPSPADARGLGERRLVAFLARQHYSGGQKPAELLAKLRRAPEGRVGEVELAARRALVLALVAAITPLVEQIKQLTQQIAAALRQHPDGEIFTSLFRTPGSVVTAAELLAEIGDCRDRYPTRDTLAADAGQAAVAVESGKHKAASFRWGCNKRLRGAFCTLADSTRHWHHGHKTVTPTRAPAATTIRARFAPSDAPDAVSCGGAGKTAPPTSPPATAACNSTSPSPSPPPRAPCPTSPPPSGCSALRSPTRRPAGPSAKRLTASRHPLPRPEVDTGRPHSCRRESAGHCSYSPRECECSADGSDATASLVAVRRIRSSAGAFGGGWGSATGSFVLRRPIERALPRAAR